MPMAQAMGLGLVADLRVKGWLKLAAGVRSTIRLVLVYIEAWPEF